MHDKYSFTNITLEDFHVILDSYAGIVPSKLSDLDKARYDTVPTGLETTTDDPSTLTKAEVVTLVDWKLSHATFRPTLKALVNQNDEDTIAQVTATAFETFSKDPKSNAKPALAELTKLKGIGPATASLLLSVYDPDHAPFFSDELFRWAFCDAGKGKGWDRPIKYTPKEYLELFGKVQELRQRLEVKAVEAEKVAYVLGKRAAGVKLSKDEAQASTTQSDTKRKAASHDERALKTTKPAKEKAVAPAVKRSKLDTADNQPATTTRTTRSSARLNADEQK
ncbi:hypothetical protein CLAFUW4_13582 [Fulvia fulva]|uniref:Uncharacterized protein n=1 Tax=Passalora fulva TaxID=5499 RepID=A0A9Q8PLI4_PASFU|nr:uncharacterized protein CLAFUR5_13433 [Fulvia fulva]KAK4610300.1 hypothetical protein CLAFUR4_13585 [Fulvia fulva]KAK4611140.1 hypothetical protein CLAFUR0_13592 [Fulvia fulva]UJO24643.1 hypothetical protein CLAFUR5_13433 [Fulvia fulva]WPV22101.1 hypothetical protein CLAFUW4_13582 [Fulvia fulva]WPV37078.1 hypothetical protein CLAFUW7_13590 [Fulvia fulva]